MPLAALSLLTVLPVPRAAHVSTRPLGRAIAYFPLVGFAIGAVVAAADALMVRGLPLGVASVIDLVLFAAITGGLHLDGLADATDGLLSTDDESARLAVMRDSRIGAFGASALVLVLLLDVAALASIPPPQRVGSLLGAAVLSRWAMTLGVRAHSPARGEGLAATVARGARRIDGILAAAAAGLVAGVVLDGPLIAVAVGVALTACIAAFADRRVGGLTGDVYGAVAEIVFAGVLVTQTASVA